MAKLLETVSGLIQNVPEFMEKMPKMVDKMIGLVENMPEFLLNKLEIMMKKKMPELMEKKKMPELMENTLQLIENLPEEMLETIP